MDISKIKDEVDRYIEASRQADLAFLQISCVSKEETDRHEFSDLIIQAHDALKAKSAAGDALLDRIEFLAQKDLEI